MRRIHLVPGVLLLSCAPREADFVQNAAPLVSLTFPADGSTVTGDFVTTARAVVNDDDGDGLLSIRWLLDGLVLEPCQQTLAAADVVADGGLTCDVLFSATPSGTSVLSIDVTDQEGEIGHGEVSVGLIPALPPQVTLLSPVEGDLLRADEPVRLLGTIIDDNDPWTDLVAWWTSDFTGRLEDAVLSADGFVDTTALLPVGDAQEICLVAMDPTSLEGKACARVDVRPANTAPTCEIRSPMDGSVGAADHPVDLQATVGDGEMELEDLLVNWASDKDGDLASPVPGTDGSVSASVVLSRDTHVLSLRVEDDGGLTCTRTVTYTAGGGPAVHILSPVDGDVYAEGDSVWFAAEVQDDETSCPDLVVSWTSDLEGEISGEPASPACITSFGDDTLAVGDHRIALVVTDGDGNRFEEEVSLSVVDCLEDWYRDLDGDGHGDPLVAASACTVPSGYVATGDDCDDLNPDVSPSASEACNGLDDDCDGVPDDGIPVRTLHRDGDGDGAGNPLTTLEACYDLSGYVEDASDCDDGEATVHPGAEEACDALDNDCDGGVDEGLTYPFGTPWYRDGDEDGYGTPFVMRTDCEQPADYVDNADDCDDDRPLAHPGAEEVCNVEDDDCDGYTDEADAVDATVLYEDADGDGYGSEDRTTTGCRSTGYSEKGGDCDDVDPTANPGVAEVCDGVDNDCDGSIDDGFSFPFDTRWYLDEDTDGFGSSTAGLTGCEIPDGFVANAEDCDDGDAAVHPGSEEVCDEQDNDCDGTVDGSGASDVLNWYRDLDGDGYGDASVTELACDAAGYSLDDGDCDDTKAGIHPGAAESCDGVDDDCDGDVDEDFPYPVDTPWYRDGDLDGWGIASATKTACTAPDQYVSVDGDCDDARPDVAPGAPETCNEVDDDCDGTVDEADASDAAWWYPDADGDLYGRTAEAFLGCLPAGFVSAGNDCDDGDPSVYPGAIETCDGSDEDCDTLVDEEWPYPFGTTWYRDEDEDGHGAATGPLMSCDEPSGYVAAAGDCNDADPDANPEQVERCNAVDDDCDGLIDEGDALDYGTWYLDVDGDGYGRDETAFEGCQLEATVTLPGDCDDDSPEVNPGATEACNGLDDDCDGGVDEDFDLPYHTIWFLDADEDGFGQASATAVGCEPPVGYVANDEDCSDRDAEVHPGGVESCNYIDDDCDGFADEADAVDGGTWYRDADRDGYGDPTSGTLACYPPLGYVADASDCDDADWYVKPGSGC